ncbi:hypothetical protein GXB81_26455 [Paraburkholderia sp. Ac-20336]|uniref:hypothetical protein n=1 Tax=Burkholderiaceae TaxID=119060 RepID=UPI0014202784|nr:MULTISPECIES: hypothetical protein [Burkholderiaceae]MBN3806564.1 hypothetical protein [Paraburkholderia sp. Ac-20336]MBN3850149.1 hypothetical protein [Paraburkholderia sp. Ac-20342]NIF53559.1 hypothetical protein [Burkholderia sp. Ax-1724]NIF81756.1 hypothetical protein [Paraburkholderia sp. Cy-641]
MKKIRTVAILLGFVVPLQAFAQSASAPDVKPGDSWTYVITVEKGAANWNQTHDQVTVLRTTSSHIYYEAHQAGSTQAPKELIAGMDWSRERSVNGTEMVVNRPLAFPLSPGKTWNIDYTEQHPNRVFASQKWSSQYRVIGTETVEVPAGKFQAIKIESEGDWLAQLEPRQTITQATQVEQGDTTMMTHAQKIAPAQATGRTYKAFWYAPEVGRWVKSVEEYYGSNGVRSERYTSELESFKKGTQ